MTNSDRDWRGLSIRLGAEMAVIILGVTIALWADGWVAQRGDRAKELARLGALKENVSTTLQQARDARDNTASASDALRTLLSPSIGDREDDEIKRLLLDGLLYGSSFFPELNVYDDLKNSGELALLSNSALRRALATMDARMEVVRFAQSDVATVMQLNVDPFLISQVDLRSLFSHLSELEQTESAGSTDFAFLNSKQFQNLLIFKLDLHVEMDERFQSAEDALLDVQQIIESQIIDQERS